MFQFLVGARPGVHWVGPAWVCVYWKLLPCYCIGHPVLQPHQDCVGVIFSGFDILGDTEGR